MSRPAFLPDNYTLCLIGTVVLASVLPCHGDVAIAFDWITDFAIGLLFFLHGAKLSRESALAGLTNWRLHLLVLLSTFALFPLLGTVLGPVFVRLTNAELLIGLMFVCVLPSTVQSAIAFTSMARGNVPAAICAASVSTLLGIVLTPLLASVLISRQVGSTDAWSSVQQIVVQLLLPFIAGQFARPFIGGWVSRHGKWLKLVDQGSILLVVYTAFSAAVVGGIWQQVSTGTLAGLLLCCATLLGLVMLTTSWTARRLGFSKADQITMTFCGSNKSLASGVPMAKVLFDSSTVGMIVLPLMIYHQLQLMTCAALAQRFARRIDDEPDSGTVLRAGGA